MRKQDIDIVSMAIAVRSPQWFRTPQWVRTPQSLRTLAGR